MNICTDCTLYCQGMCRLKYKDPVDGVRILEPLSAYEARSYSWACGSGAMFFSSVPAPLYEKLLGTFDEDQVLHKSYPHEE